MKPHSSSKSPEMNGNQCKIPATVQIQRRAVNMIKGLGKLIPGEGKRAKYVLLPSYTQRSILNLLQVFDGRIIVLGGIKVLQL